MNSDIWHYSRAALAEQVLNLFEIGLANALVFFAPRRMGKTEFLRQDIIPLAEKQNWQVLYFSFLDVKENAAQAFTQALTNFAKETNLLNKSQRLFNKVSKVSGEVMGVKAGLEFHDSNQMHHDMKQLLSQLQQRGRLLLLLDEIQTLAQDKTNDNFLASLRTSLDINKQTIKVIFTGSSQDGLRRMFSMAKAPFFHFGQNLPFPQLNHEFTQHMATIFHKVTQRHIDKEKLWAIFQEMQYIPQLLRTLVERLALNPPLSIEEAKNQLLTEIYASRAFTECWDLCSALEKMLLNEIATGAENLFSQENRQRLAKALGISTLPVSSLQSALRVLQRKNLLGRYPERGGYFIEDPNFKNWVTDKIYSNAD